MSERIYLVTYAEDGRILTVGSIHPRFASREIPKGYLYTTQLPDSDHISRDYKVQNGMFIYDPQPEEPKPEEPPSETYTALINLMTAQSDTDAMLVDQEYRLTVMEMGI